MESIQTKTNNDSAVSVCMATRNGARYLELQLQSIIDQLQPGDELVISDDSSTDRSVEIIKQFEGPNVRLFLGNKFFNPIGNFEYCLRQARNDILVLADQDDIWLDNRLAVVRQHLAGRTTDICGIMTDADFVDAEGQPTGKTLFRNFRAGTGVLRNLIWNCYTGCAMAVTRPLLEMSLPFPKGIPMHDAWLGLLCEASGSMELVPEKTFLYRRHLQSASGWRWQPGKQIMWRWVLAKHLWKRIKQKGINIDQKGTP